MMNYLCVFLENIFLNLELEILFPNKLFKNFVKEELFICSFVFFNFGINHIELEILIIVITISGISIILVFVLFVVFPSFIINFFFF